jgi:hypothetical protein
MSSVLIITNEQDLGADLVVLELGRRGVEVLRCNTERLTDWRISCRPGSTWTLEDQLGRVAASVDVGGVWWRRPEPPIPPVPLASAEEAEAFRAQWQALLEGLASVPGPRWISPPAAIRAAEDKALQLAAARRLGFQVPETIWTNAAKAIEAAGPAVVKPITTAAWSDDEGPAFVFAQLLAAERLPAAEELVQLPAAFQRPIWPKRDLRVTVVGERVMAAIAAETASDELDWRLNPDRDWRPFALPESDGERCRALLVDLGLRFGGIDLVKDKAGALWFLEVNPNGEWGWLSQLAGLPIVAAICNELAGGDGDSG